MKKGHKMKKRNFYRPDRRPGLRKKPKQNPLNAAWAAMMHARRWK